MLKCLKNLSFCTLFLFFVGFGCIARRAPSSDANGNDGGVVVVPPPEKEPDDPGTPPDNFEYPAGFGGAFETDTGGKTRLNLNDINPRVRITYGVNNNIDSDFYFSPDDNPQGTRDRAHYLMGKSVPVDQTPIPSKAYFSFPYLGTLTSGNNWLNGKKVCVVAYRGVANSFSSVVDSYGPDGFQEQDEYCEILTVDENPSTWRRLDYDVEPLWSDIAGRGKILLVAYIGDSKAVAKDYFALPYINAVPANKKRSGKKLQLDHNHYLKLAQKKT